VTPIPDELLSLVQKPARYIGREWNAIVKDPRGAALRWALCFPDIYDVGIAHLGLRVLYHILNQVEDVVCERVFLPWPDYRALLESTGSPLCSLENQLPLDTFDVVGFSLQYELSYPAVLEMLRLGGIAARARDRGERDPLVIAGGPCALNPEPLADFLDAVCLGDGEDVVLEITECVRQGRSAGAGRGELLRELARIEGLYVPGLYSVEYGADGRVRCIEPQSGVPPVVTRRFVRDLDAAAFPTRPIVPYVEAVHDRVAIEVSRGCTRGCRFCHAGMTYRPVRERTPDTIVRLARESIDATGYDEVSLLSLSTADYSQIEPLCDALLEEFDGQHVSLSLPSLRVDSFSVALCEKVSRVRKSGITLAPEAGTQRLRDVINKPVTDSHIEEAVRAAFAAGHQSVKAYFMIGLPTETEADLEGIIGVLEHIRRLADAMKVRRRGPVVNVSLATFVPKPHTPFQWEPMTPIEEARRRQRFVVNGASPKHFRVRWHDAEQGLVEAILARGDRRLGPVLQRVAGAGGGMEAWSEYFSLERWLAAMDAERLDPRLYAGEWPENATLPWDHLSTGVRREFLLGERRRSRQGVTTPDCRVDGCQGCGGFCENGR